MRQRSRKARAAWRVKVVGELSGSEQVGWWADHDVRLLRERWLDAEEAAQRAMPDSLQPLGRQLSGSIANTLDPTEIQELLDLLAAAQHARDAYIGAVRKWAAEQHRR
jgi:hypothetical protein